MVVICRAICQFYFRHICQEGYQSAAKIVAHIYINTITISKRYIAPRPPAQSACRSSLKGRAENLPGQVDITKYMTSPMSYMISVTIWVESAPSPGLATPEPRAHQPPIQLSAIATMALTSVHTSFSPSRACLVANSVPTVEIFQLLHRHSRKST